jgi:DNA-binding NarL/FixJ family response regulator
VIELPRQATGEQIRQTPPPRAPSVNERLSEKLELIIGRFQFTARERDCVREMLKGDSFKEIGARLFICEKSVKAHSCTINKKLGVRGRPKMMATFFQLLFAELATA